MSAPLHGSVVLRAPAWTAMSAVGLGVGMVIVLMGWAPHVLNDGETWERLAVVVAFHVVAFGATFALWAWAARRYPRIDRSGWALLAWGAAVPLGLLAFGFWTAFIPLQTFLMDTSLNEPLR